MQKLLENLNTEQRKAVENTEGPTLIVAGAGAGKTKTLTTRIVYLIHQGIDPKNILAITFTNKAAREMRERVEKLLKEGGIDATPLLTTFHSLGVSILRENAHLVGRNKYFGILDESDAVKLVKDSIVEIGLDPKQYEPRKFKSIISREKGNFVTLSNYTEKADTHIEQTVQKIWEKYERKLQEEKVFDFDDLLLQTVLLFRKHPEVLEQYQNRFLYIHIDEYQDTNEVQYEMTKQLAGIKHNICVVGDTDQNIYSWRGAKIKNMIHFEKDFPNTKTFFLEQNYRSTQKILRAANAVIDKNTVRIPKTLYTKNSDGEDITLYESYDEVAEAEFVVDEITYLLDRGIKPENIAVLYRANFQSRVLEEAFLGRTIAYQIVGTKFYDRKEVKDILSYIRASLDNENLGDIKRIINVPVRGIGKVTIAKLFAGIKNELPHATLKKIDDFYNLLLKIKGFIDTNKPSEIVKFVLKESGIESTLKSGTSEDLERLENIGELITLSTRYDNFEGGYGLEKLLDDAALASDQDNIDENSRVRLMTVHAAKGLEFGYVFITGLEQDLFPHARSGMETTEDKEEERRLFYVALTRAEKKLYLTYATVRTLFGMRQVNTPSEFIYDIPDDTLLREVVRIPKTKVIYIE